jgi:ankyrin repeat protein
MSFGTVPPTNSSTVVKTPASPEISFVPGPTAADILAETGIPVTEAELIARVLANDLETVRLLLEAGVSANATDGGFENVPALVLAAEQGQRPMIELLLEHGADPDFTTGGPGEQDIRNAMRVAVRQADQSLIDLFVAHGGDLTPPAFLFDACEGGQMDMVERLLPLHPNLDQLVDVDGLGLIAYATIGDNMPVVERLIAAGASVNPPAGGVPVTPPLMIACSVRNEPIFNLLLEKGAQVNVADPRTQMTPLHYAVSSQWMVGVETLLAKSAALEAKNAIGETPFIIAAWRNDIPIMEALYAKGADIMARMDNEITALHQAATRSRDGAALTWLLDRGLEVNALDGNGLTALDYIWREAAGDVLRARGGKTGAELRGEQ